MHKRASSQKQRTPTRRALSGGRAIARPTVRDVADGRMLWMAVLCILSLALYAHDVRAGSIEKLDNIRQAVRSFTIAKVGDESDNVQVKLGRLDPRLRLPKCDTDLDTYFAPGAKTLGRTSVGVRCEGPKAWSLYVPVFIDRLVAIAVAQENIPSGHIVTAADMHFEQRSAAKLNGNHFTARDQLLGKVTRRPLQRGAAFTQNAVKNARLVRRGERVVLALKTGTVAVRVAGTAMRDGTLGERIPVRNLSSKRIIEGTVHEAGLVLVGKPHAKM